MTARRLWPAFALALFPALTALAADDPFGDPLPAGAKLRLGTARMRTSFGNGPTAITPDGKAMVAIVPDGTMAFLDPTTGKPARTVKSDFGFGNTSAFSADGSRALTTSYGVAGVWDTKSGATLLKIDRPLPGGENGAALSADGRRLALGSVKEEPKDEKDKAKPVTAVVWDVDAKKELATVAVVQNQTANVVLSPDGKRLATWGYSAARDLNAAPPEPANDPARAVQFWDATSGKELARVQVLSGFAPAAVAFSPDGSLAAVSGGEGEIILVDPATGATKLSLIGRSRQGRRLAFSPDGKTLAAAGDDGSVQRWIVVDGKRLDVTDAPIPFGYAPRGIQYTDNQRAVVWATRNVTTVVWEVPIGKLLSPIGGHTAAIRSAAVPPASKELLTASDDGEIYKWDPATGKSLGSMYMKAPSVGIGTSYVTGPVTLSPDGTRALSGEGFGGSGVYDTATGSQLFALPGYGGNTRAGFTPDGTRIIQALTSFDPNKAPSRVLVWDVATTRKLGEVALPGVAYPAAAVSPDGKSLITAGLKQKADGKLGDFLVTGWELATGKKLGEYKEPGGYETIYLVAAGDNKSVVATSPKFDGKLMVVDFVAGTRARDFDLERSRPVAAPAVSPDGKLVAIPLAPDFGPRGTATVAICDIETGKVKKKVSGVSGMPTLVLFSADGKTLVTGSQDTTVLLWDISGM